MEQEQQPDREGYLDYCTKIDSGDHELAAQAELLSETSQPSALGQYHEMREIEHAIAHYSREDIRDIVQGYEMTSLHGLMDNAIRTAAINEMNKAAAQWDAERLRDHVSHNEMHKSTDFSAATKQRQKAHPRETEGQAWFQAKINVEADYLDWMDGHRAALTRSLDQIAERAKAKDSASQRGDQGYAEWRAALRQARKDRSPDREG